MKKYFFFVDVLLSILSGRLIVRYFCNWRKANRGMVGEFPEIITDGRYSRVKLKVGYRGLTEPGVGGTL